MTTPPPPSEGYYGGGPNEDDKTKAMVAHYGLIAYLCCGFGAIIPALIIYVMSNDSPWAKREAAKSFNFAIIPVGTLVAIWVVNFFLGRMGIAFVGCLFNLIALALWIGTSALGIMSGIKVGNGEETSYPIEVPILK